MTCSSESLGFAINYGLIFVNSADRIWDPDATQIGRTTPSFFPIPSHKLIHLFLHIIFRADSAEMPAPSFSKCPSGPPCPFRTSLPESLQEASGIPLAEIKAYKLGKKRWSYNQVEVVVSNPVTNNQLGVKQAVHLGNSVHGAADSGVSFQLQLANDEKLQLDAFLVYDIPRTSSETQHEW